jgi:hypothetical protein
MALTQISTAGVKDDAVTSGKIPANAVGSSELADNAVDTAAIADDAVTNAKIGASAAIAGTKISPDFGSQNIATTGTLSITSAAPQIFLTDSNANSDYAIVVNTGQFRIRDETNSADRFAVNSDGHVDIQGRLDAIGGLKVYEAGSTFLKLGTEAGGIDSVFFDTSHGSNTKPNMDFKLDDDLAMRITPTGNVAIGATSTSSFNGVGSTHRLIVAGSTTDTDITDNSGAAITISNTDGTANNTAGLHFAREDTDGTPHYDGASIVAQFKETMNTGHYPKADLAFLTATADNNAPSEKMRLLAAGGLTFNGDTAAANALNDYEEGTFTPTNVSAYGVSDAFSGKYVKVGALVHFEIQQTAGTYGPVSGNAMSGLPFQPEGRTAGSATNDSANISSNVLIYDNSYVYFTTNHGNQSTYKITGTYRTAA